MSTLFKGIEASLSLIASLIGKAAKPLFLTEYLSHTHQQAAVRRGR